MAGDKGLTALEKRIVKALLAKGERNQDIHALINYERTPTVNFGRITTVKKDATIQPASDEEIEIFQEAKAKLRSRYGTESLLRRAADARPRGDDSCGDHLQQQHL
ncbi:hypothetical protein [Candidatus Phyllobacterium onerii]|uniref:hypothetical protein n=1 Tax=Candidatus Phyllobacterium onerii TaxID=3020828 RepID=UPI00232C1BD3|nr:hypothetical protein [Phyllobacterium sp. IY22]